MSARRLAIDHRDADTGTALKPTRTDGTLEQYRREGQNLLARYLRVVGLRPGGGESNPNEFARWLANQRLDYRPTTWRFYRQSALYLIESWPDADLEAVALVLYEVPSVARKPPPRTSARKLKRIPAPDFRSLCRYLTRKSSTNAAWETRDWLIAGVATGLRPGEWRQSTLIRRGDQHLLAFIREKTTNGRSLGEQAVLDVSALGAIELAAIQRMTEHGGAWHATKQYAPKQESCGQVLRAACRSLWPRRTRGYSLYSCRHQATSHCKAALTVEEVAAVLGHAVSHTMMSYGKRRDAWSVDCRHPPPLPLPGAAGLVRSTRKTSRLRRDRTITQGSPPVTQGPG